jgi:hypothetical protein
MDRMEMVANLFETLNMGTKIQLAVLQMFEVIRQQGVEEEDISMMKDSFDVNALMKAVMTTWAKYYSDQDITGLIQFYQTPTGRKMLEVEPLIQKETELATQQLLQATIAKLTDE